LGDKAVDSFRHRTVTMAELLGAAPPIAEVKAAVAEACASVLGVELEPAPLTPEEADRWSALQDRYRDQQWIERRTPPTGGGYTVTQAVFKAPGGLIRAYLQVDEAAGRIRKAFLTGDFFALPDRAPLDLEAALKDAPISVEAIAHRVEHHYRQGYRYLGVAPEDWLRVIVEAAQGGVGSAVREQGRNS
jgi:lipoate-protein ligase A